MLNIKSAIITVLLTTSASAAQAEICTPVAGGSEHSVGVPGPETDEALAAYEESNYIQGQVELLKRQGYCPSAPVNVTVTRRDCASSDDSGCTVHYAVSQEFTKGWFRRKTVTGTLVQPHDWRALFFAEDLNVTGLGRTLELPRTTSDALMEAMEVAGIEDNRGIMGSYELFAGRIVCSQPVIPDPVPSCELVNHDALRSLDEAASATMMQLLLRQRAFIGPDNLVGAVHVGAALLTCSRIVHPEAHATCEMLIEKR